MDSKTELFGLLAKVTPEQIRELLNVVESGLIHGWTYYCKTRGCVYGTIGHILTGASYIDFEDLPIKPDREEAAKDVAAELTPLESFVTHIEKGHTPANNEHSAWLATWIREYLEAVRS